MEPQSNGVYPLLATPENRRFLKDVKPWKPRRSRGDHSCQVRSWRSTHSQRQRVIEESTWLEIGTSRGSSSPEQGVRCGLPLGRSRGNCAGPLELGVYHEPTPTGPRIITPAVAAWYCRAPGTRADGLATPHWKARLPPGRYRVRRIASTSSGRLGRGRARLAGPLPGQEPDREGAIGLVFLAEDTHSRPARRPEGHQAGTGRYARVQDRFVREAQATAAIKHDHIVTIYQVGRDHDTLFLAMEYLQGLSLQSWLERGRKPSTDLVLRIGREIASGLAAAHRNGLIHRDIKPANIWLESPSGRVKILDFGMARSERDDVQITHAGTVMGTPAYMAPEQARGEVAGAGSDLFSLGCVLYRLCAGRPAVRGCTILAVLSALASDTPRTLREIDPDDPPGTGRLVTRLLAKDPSARPASAQAVVEAIRAIERDLLADRQKVELSDVTESVCGRGRSATSVRRERDRGGPRPEPGDRRRAWGLAAVVAVVADCCGSHSGPRPTSPRDARGGEAAVASAAGPRCPRCARGHDGCGGGQGISTDRSRSPDSASRLAATGNGSHRPDGPRHAAWPRTRRTRPKLICWEDRRGTASPEVPHRLAAMRADPGEPVSERLGQADRPRRRLQVRVRPEQQRDQDRRTRNAPRPERRAGTANAPRVLRPVRGYFDASVIVDGVFHPSGRATTKEYAPYHGAGILLWQDDRNYVRLEIAADVRHGKPRSYANFELARAAGSPSPRAGDQGWLDASAARASGSEVRAAFGPDGSRWTWFAPLPWNSTTG